MKKTILSIVSVIVLALALSSCSAIQKISGLSNTPIGASTVSDARNSLYAIQNGYAAAIVVAEAYVRLTPCSVPNAPKLCASTPVVRQLARAQLAASAAILSAEEVVLNSKESTSALSAAIASAGGAYDAFKAIMKTYSVE